IAVPPHYFKNVLAALYKKGRLVGYAVFEKFEPSPSAYVSTDDFDEVRVGKIRVDPHGLQELEPLP
ncbi:MAG: GTPase, partial [Pyrobaculum sp.]